MSEIVKNYIEKIKENNSNPKERTETRANFFYVPKLNEMMLMEKIVTSKAKISNVQLYIMKRKKYKNHNLSNLTKGKRKEFFLDNLNNYEVFTDTSIGTMLSYIDKYSYVDYLSPSVNRLSLLKVHQYYRGLGLSKELINELINETALYDYPLITARMSPLDYTADPYPEEELEIDQRIHEISPKRELSAPVDIDALAKIYESLGFAVPADYNKDRNISMAVKYSQIKKRDLYPEEFCEFDKHKETPIIVR